MSTRASGVVLTLGDDTDGHDLKTFLQAVCVIRPSSLPSSDALNDHADDVCDGEDDREGLGRDGRVLRAAHERGVEAICRYEQ